MRMKRLSDILGRLIDLTLINTNEINDFSPGSTIRSIYEAIAMELEQFYLLNRENILWGIDQGIFNAFDFHRQEPRRAYGDVVLEFHTTLSSGVTIPRGTKFYSSTTGYQQQFETLEAFHVPAGRSKVRIEVYCTEPGLVGNVPQGAINQASSPIFNLSKVYNPHDFLTGRDMEPLDQVKRRFRAFVDTRGRATNKSIQYGASLVEDITGVYVKEDVGYIRVYAHDGNGNLSQDLKADVENALEEYRPSGIRLDVLPMSRKTVDVDVTIVLRDTSRYNEPFRREVATAIRDYINALEASDNLILNDLIQEIMNVDHFNIQDLYFQNLNSNIRVEEHELLRAGTVTVSFEVPGQNVLGVERGV